MFEPHPAAFARLSDNLARNRIRCVEAHAVGVWDSECTVSVVDDVPGNSGAAHLEAGGRVPVITIDEFCHRRAVHRLDLMKIDAEVSDLRVLRGAARTLEALRPELLVELNAAALARDGTSAGDLLDLLGRRVYRIRPVGRRSRCGPEEPRRGHRRPALHAARSGRFLDANLANQLRPRRYPISEC